MKLNDVEHVYFDLDHTLWDFKTNSREALGEIYSKYKLDEKRVRHVDDFIRVYEKINHSMWAGYRAGTVSKSSLRKDRFPRALAAFGNSDMQLAKDINEYYMEHSPRKTNLFEQAHETLHYLNDRYQLHIITNGFQEVQHLKMDRSGLSQYFDQVITSEMVGVRKPDPRIFEFALKKAGALADHSIMIGDDIEADVRGAKACGMRGVFFNPEQETNDIPVDKEIQTLSELRTLL